MHLGLEGAFAVGDGAAQVVQGALLDVQAAMGLHAGGAEGMPAPQPSTLGPWHLLQADATRPHSQSPSALRRVYQTHGMMITT